VWALCIGAALAGRTGPAMCGAALSVAFGRRKRVYGLMIGLGYLTTGLRCVQVKTTAPKRYCVKPSAVRFRPLAVVMHQKRITHCAYA
jgi:hypothetical protein